MADKCNACGEIYADGPMIQGEAVRTGTLGAATDTRTAAHGSTYEVMGETGFCERCGKATTAWWAAADGDNRQPWCRDHGLDLSDPVVPSSSRHLGGSLVSEEPAGRAVAAAEATGFCDRCGLPTHSWWVEMDAPRRAWCPAHGVYLSRADAALAAAADAFSAGWSHMAADAMAAPRHLGGPTDDHYATLKVQPIECVEAWSPTWDPRIVYHVAESVQALARCGTKGQAERDLRKVSWLCERAADILAGKDLRAPSDKRR